MQTMVWSPWNPGDGPDEGQGAGPGQAQAPGYPVQTLRHMYVTPFGGFSPDLQVGEIGIHHEALARNTQLRPYEDAVMISKVAGAVRVPFIMKFLFRVVPVDETMRDAWEKTRRGEAVLPHELPGQPSESARIDLARGDELVLNGVLSARGFRLGPPGAS